MKTLTKKLNKSSLNHLPQNISKTFSKLLLSIIFVLASLIYTNLSPNNYTLYKKKILSDNIHYPKFRKLYEKYFGKILPSGNVKTTTVFNNNLPYSKIIDGLEEERIVFDESTIIEAIQSGIVVYLGEKDNLGYTAIVQGIDDVDIWYSNIQNCNLKLYDYIEKGKVIGEVDNELKLKIMKNNNNLKYEEYIKTL